MTNSSPAPKKGPENYKIRPDADTLEQRLWLKKATEVSEEDLNKHLINRHLVFPVSFYRVGLLFDAELAAYLGYSLQPTADAANAARTALNTGNFGNTDTYKRMVEYLSPEQFALQEFTPSRVAHSLDSMHHYRERLVTELTTLGRLGVAEVGNIPIVSPTSWVPPVTDSFFRMFNIVPVD